MKNIRFIVALVGRLVFCNNNTDIGDLSANIRTACAPIWLALNHKFARDHVKIAFSPEHVHAFNGIDGTANTKAGIKKNIEAEIILSIYFDSARSQ